jgi:hypothetical protein
VLNLVAHWLDLLLEKLIESRWACYLVALKEFLSLLCELLAKELKILQKVEVWNEVHCRGPSCTLEEGRFANERSTAILLVQKMD